MIHPAAAAAGRTRARARDARTSDKIRRIFGREGPISKSAAVFEIARRARGSRHILRAGSAAPIVTGISEGVGVRNSRRCTGVIWRHVRAPVAPGTPVSATRVRCAFPHNNWIREIYAGMRNSTDGKDGPVALSRRAFARSARQQDDNG